MKDLEAEPHLLAAGWILEEEHDPSVSYYLGRDPRLADVLVNAMAGAVELIEREIVARIPGAGPDASSPKTGNGIFAICLYPDKIMAYLFDVTMLNWNDRRSYGIQVQALQAVLSQPATGPVTGRIKITGRAFN